MTKLHYQAGARSYGLPPRFEPLLGNTVVEPPALGPGSWAGAPSAIYDANSGTYYVTYRKRLARSSGGHETGIVASSDGFHFETIWMARSEDFGARALEKSCLVRTAQGTWRLYLALEAISRDASDPGRWRIDVLEADSPEHLSAALARPVLEGALYGFTKLQDPTVILLGGEYQLYATATLREPPPDLTAEELPAHTLRPRTCCVLLRSSDGWHFPSAQRVFGPTGSGWDGSRVRLTSVCYLAPLWLAFYDGSPHRAAWEAEATGLCLSHDLVQFRSVTTSEPWLRSPVGTGALRYLEALPVNDSMHYFYEYARADGAHELRHNAVPLH